MNIKQIIEQGKVQYNLTIIGLYFEFYHNAKVDDIGYEYMMR